MTYQSLIKRDVDGRRELYVAVMAPPRIPADVELVAHHRLEEAAVRISRASRTARPRSEAAASVRRRTPRCWPSAQSCAWRSRKPLSPSNLWLSVACSSRSPTPPRNSPKRVVVVHGQRQVGAKRQLPSVAEIVGTLVAQRRGPLIGIALEALIVEVHIEAVQRLDDAFRIACRYYLLLSDSGRGTMSDAAANDVYADSEVARVLYMIVAAWTHCLPLVLVRRSRRPGSPIRASGAYRSWNVCARPRRSRAPSRIRAQSSFATSMQRSRPQALQYWQPAFEGLRHDHALEQRPNSKPKRDGLGAGTCS